MLKHVYLILIATFIFGFLCGVILFHYNNTGEEGGGKLKNDTYDVTITARAYGGCERGARCASYRIVGGGAYSFIPQTGGDNSVKYEGALNEKQQDVLFSALAETDLATAHSISFDGTCPADHDGIAYRYDIVRGGEEYSFDSCAVDVSATPLFATLKTYFTYFSTTHSSE